MASRHQVLARYSSISIERSQFFSHRVHERGTIGRETHDSIHILRGERKHCVWKLAKGDVKLRANFRCVVGIYSGVLHVPRDSNDLDQRARESSSNVSPNGILPWESFASQLLVNHSHRLGLIRLLASEEAAADKRYSHRTEVISRDRIHICDSYLVFRNARIILPAESGLGIPHKRQ